MFIVNLDARINSETYVTLQGDRSVSPALTGATCCIKTSQLKSFTGKTFQSDAMSCHSQPFKLMRYRYEN